MLIPPSEIKKKIDELVRKLGMMFLTDIKDMPDVSESLASTYESPSAEKFISIVKEHMKDNKEFDFLRIDDNPYRAYFLRERMAAYQSSIQKHRETIEN